MKKSTEIAPQPAAAVAPAQSPHSASTTACEVVVLRSNCVEISPSRWGRRGSNDESVERTQVSAIVGRDGNRIEGCWTDDWREVSNGLHTRLVDGLRAVRIHRAACPLTVEMQHDYEYVCHDDADACSRGTTAWWVRYEGGDRD